MKNEHDHITSPHVSKTCCASETIEHSVWATGDLGCGEAQDERESTTSTEVGGPDCSSSVCNPDKDTKNLEEPTRLVKDELGNIFYSKRFKVIAGGVDLFGSW